MEDILRAILEQRRLELAEISRKYGELLVNQHDEEVDACVNDPTLSDEQREHLRAFGERSKLQFRRIIEELNHSSE